MATTPPLTFQQIGLANEQAKLAVQFSTYFVIAPPPSRDVTPDTQFNNGSITLVELGGRHCGITNWHVVDKYRERKNAGEKIVCQIGNVLIDPQSRLIDESEALDLAVLDLSDVDVAKIRGGREVPCQFHVPGAWPPERPAEGTYVAFGGWPKSRRQMRSANLVEFGAVCSGATEVQSSHENLLRCAIQIDQATMLFDREGAGIPDLPGMSGGPVIYGREINGVLVFEMVGVIFEHNENLDALYIRPTSLIRANGTLFI